MYTRHHDIAGQMLLHRHAQILLVRICHDTHTASQRNILHSPLPCQADDTVALKVNSIGVQGIATLDNGRLLLVLNYHPRKEVPNSAGIGCRWGQQLSLKLLDEACCGLQGVLGRRSSKCPWDHQKALDRTTASNIAQLSLHSSCTKAVTKKQFQELQALRGRRIV